MFISKNILISIAEMGANNDIKESERDLAEISWPEVSFQNIKQTFVRNLSSSMLTFKIDQTIYH